MCRKTNVRDYFKGVYEKKVQRAKRASQLLESSGGVLADIPFFDKVAISAHGIFSPQKRTSFMEDALVDMFHWKKVKASEDKGDYIDCDGKYFELKCSSSNDADTINILQVRPWQEVDYYVVIYFDLDVPSSSKVYVLQKSEMVEEVEKLGHPSHGTSTANQENGKIEYSIHLPIENEWDGKYLKERFFLDESGQ